MDNLRFKFDKDMDVRRIYCMIPRTLGFLGTDLSPGHSWDSIRIEDKTARQAHEWSYSSHRESIDKTLSSPGIRSNKKTHINCGSSARMAGNCANMGQIRRQGRWSNTTINGAYLTNLPRELVRSMADFPAYGRFFYLARAALNPPTSLCKKLFSAIGE
ncbi:hypothetical protein [Absidia glauca]|uniref:Ndc10 domain-containing protein n=1 Tax=Absidia glauca TaxID=4829 RepID=A0A163JAQ1_ABSGL|nr:hypothetical protein [Absidia glauca]